MIDLYTWTTPNGRKVSIALEELQLEYRVRPVDLSRGEQRHPDFLLLNPNGRIPAIVDDDGPDGTTLKLFESGAILLYLAEKTGRLLPATGYGRWEGVQWLMWQMGGLGPMAGQAAHFVHFTPEDIPYAVERYTGEVERLLGVLETRLDQADFLAGQYSVADIACYPWVVACGRLGLGLDGWPRLSGWVERVGDRPAVRRGMEVPEVG